MVTAKLEVFRKNRTTENLSVLYEKTFLLL